MFWFKKENKELSDLGMRLNIARRNSREAFTRFYLCSKRGCGRWECNLAEKEWHAASDLVDEIDDKIYKYLEKQKTGK